MTATVETGTADHAELRAQMVGPVIDPSDPGYDEARRLWNGAVDRRPAVLARCAGPADVATAITYARRTGLEIAVRGGAHNTSGQSGVDGGLVVDLSAMNAVEVDPDARRVRVGGGALLSDMDAATQEYGLAVPAGEISHTGVGGLTLGGGMGWLTRQYGLTVDAMRSAEVVLADGSVVRASDEENPELFWALRGGGGNFGVVTEFEFACYPVGPMISFGMFFYGLDDGPSVLRAARAVVPALPDSVSFQVVALNAPPAPFIPQELHFRPGYALAVIGTGDPQDAETVHTQLRAIGPTPLVEFVTPMPFTALQQMFDEADAWGVHCYEKSSYVADLTDPLIDVITDHVARKVSPMSIMHLYTLTGAYCTPDDDATSFGGLRTPRLGVFVVGITPGPDGLDDERTWVRAFHGALEPHAITGGGYVNAMTADEADRVASTYGAKYERLTLIKAAVDPQNVFHRNANILPAT